MGGGDSGRAQPGEGQLHRREHVGLRPDAGHVHHAQPRRGGDHQEKQLVCHREDRGLVVKCLKLNLRDENQSKREK